MTCYNKPTQTRRLLLDYLYSKPAPTTLLQSVMLAGKERVWSFAQKTRREACMALLLPGSLSRPNGLKTTVSQASLAPALKIQTPNGSKPQPPVAPCARLDLRVGRHSIAAEIGDRFRGHAEDAAGRDGQHPKRLAQHLGMTGVG